MKLPHPLAHSRVFVLAPWAEIDPTAELPGRGRISDLLARADLVGVVRRDDLAVDKD